MRRLIMLLGSLTLLVGFSAISQAQPGPGVNHIPPDATAAVVVYPQKLIANDLTDELDPTGQVDGFKEQFGVDPKEITSVLGIIFPPGKSGEPDFGMVVTSRRVISLDDVLAKQQAEGEYKQVKNNRSGVTYLHPRDPEMPVVYPVSGNVVVVALQATAGRIIAQGASNQEGDLAKFVKGRLTQSEVQLYFVMEPIKEMAAAMLGGLDLPGPFAAVRNLPSNLRQAELQIALSGPRSGVTLQLTGNDEEAAESLEGLLNTGLSMLEPMLETIPQEMLSAAIAAAAAAEKAEAADAANRETRRPPPRRTRPGARPMEEELGEIPMEGGDLEAFGGGGPGAGGGKGNPVALLMAELKPKRTRSVVRITTVGSKVLTPEFLASIGPAMAMGAMMGGAMPGEGEIEFDFDMEGPGVGSGAAKTSNNLKQLMLAWHNYHDTFARFPTFPSDPSHIGEDGKPHLSWRVHILPFIEEQPLYEQFKLDEPWDSEHNMALVAKMPAVLRSPGVNPQLAAEGKTRYLVPKGPGMPGSVSGKLSIRDITDGTSNTICLVEAPESAAVVWTKPDDLEITPAIIMALMQSAQGGTIPVALYDGSAQQIPITTDPQILKAMLTHAGGETIPQE